MTAKALLVSATVIVGGLATPTGADFAAPAQWGPTELGPKQDATTAQYPPPGQTPHSASSTYCRTPHYHCDVASAPIGSKCWCAVRGPTGQPQSENGEHVGAPN